MFEMIWNLYVNTCGCSRLIPLGLHFLLHFCVFYWFYFIEKVVGPGLHVATPVTIYLNVSGTCTCSIERSKYMGFMRAM